MRVAVLCVLCSEGYGHSFLRSSNTIRHSKDGHTLSAGEAVRLLQRRNTQANVGKEKRERTVWDYVAMGLIAPCVVWGLICAVMILRKQCFHYQPTRPNYMRSYNRTNGYMLAEGNICNVLVRIFFQLEF